MLGRNELRSGNAGASNRAPLGRNLSYYDLVLVLLPLPLLVGLLVDRILPGSHAGLLAGAVVSALVVAHVLFWRPPTRQGPHGRRGDWWT